MKKTIKIFALPSHQTIERTSGVDFVRIIQPMKYLDGYEDDEVKFRVDVYDIHKKQPSWLDIAKKYDIIFLNYIGNPWTFAGMGAMARHYKRKIVMDTDDDIHSIMPDNPVYKSYQENDGLALKDLTAIYNEVDYITCTTKYLKNVLLTRSTKTSKQIEVLPNYIDIDTLYTHRSPFKDTHSIQLYHYGSTTHFMDLDEKEFAKGIDMVFKNYPNVTLKTVGAFLPKYKERWGQRYTNAYGDTDIYKWIKEKFPLFMDESDIMVVPLLDGQYTRSKSAIKFLESSSAKKPGVYQNMKQYRDIVYEGRNGFLATRSEDWYNAISKLIEDKKLRQNMGEEAFKTVKIDHQMKDNVWRYAEFFKRVLTSEK